MKITSFFCFALITSISVFANEINIKDLAFAKAKTFSETSSKTTKEPSTIRVALLPDTSNSMDELIDQARA